MLLYNGLENRIFINGNGTSVSTLSINNVELDDFATYRCYDSVYDFAEGQIKEKRNLIFLIITYKTFFKSFFY